MNTTFFRSRRYRNIPLWATALVCLNGVACFRSLDPSKVKCSSEAHCPKPYTCSIYGHCVLGPASLDGSTVDLSLSPRPDGEAGADGTGSSDGAGGSRLDGSIDGGGTTTAVDGPGGMSGPIDAPLGGAGGAGGTGSRRPLLENSSHGGACASRETALPFSATSEISSDPFSPMKFS